MLHGLCFCVVCLARSLFCFVVVFVCVWGVLYGLCGLGLFVCVVFCLLRSCYVFMFLGCIDYLCCVCCRFCLYAIVCVRLWFLLGMLVICLCVFFVLSSCVMIVCLCGCTCLRVCLWVGGRV